MQITGIRGEFNMSKLKNISGRLMKVFVLTFVAVLVVVISFIKTNADNKKKGVALYINAPSKITLGLDGKRGDSYSLGAVLVYNDTEKLNSNDEKKKLKETRLSEDVISNLVKWKSSELNVATVNENGWVTAIGEGKTTITAEYDNHSATVEVEVKETETKELLMSEKNLVLQKSKHDKESQNPYILWALARDSRDKEYNVTHQSDTKWESSDESIITVLGGAITAVREGKATVTAKYRGLASTAVVTVEDKKPIEITISKNSINIEEKGESEFLTAFAKLDDGTTMDITAAAVWSSSDQNVATAYAGRVIAEGKGETTVTVSFKGFSKIVGITVEK